MPKFETDRDAAMRLSGTVVRYKGKACYIEEVIGRNAMNVFFPHTNKTKVMDYNDDDFDFSSAPLGYINHRGRAYYALRQPHRRWKQGIGRDNFKVKGGMGDRGVFNSEGMHQCIENVYPTFEASVLAVRRGDDATSMAYHRDWAIAPATGTNAGQSLMFKNANVGRVVNGKPILKAAYRYLAECLEASK